MRSVLVPAAGSGERLGSTLPKALVSVAGRPLLLWSLESLAQLSAVDEVLVAAPSAWLGQFESLRKANPGLKWTRTMVGGATRRSSVRCLLDAARCERVVVHDAARPCLTAQWVQQLIDQLGDHVAGVPAVEVRDTLKRGRDGRVVETVSREGLYAIQTPQLFKTELLRRAHAQAPAEAHPTDDAGLVEMLGAEVRLLSGAPSNLKVTYPEDIPLITRLLEREHH